VLVLGASACQAAERQAARPDPEPTAAPANTEVAAEEPASPPPAAPEDPPSASDVPVAACTAGDLAEIVDVVGGQLADLRAGDFEAALGWATPAFRSSRSADEFATLIADGFPELLAATSHDVTACAASTGPGGSSRQALAAVTVDGADGALDLQYLLEDGAEGWRISAAAPAGTPPGDGAVI
jgi:hypothetical protein